MSSLNNRIDDVLDYSKEKLREIKGEIKEIKKVPGKYAYIFEKMIALQDFTVSGVERVLKTRKGGFKTRRLKATRVVKHKNC
jgi:hypothetical protein